MNRADNIALLRRAANLLEVDATELRQGHNVDPQQPDWTDEPDAKVAHDEALSLAVGLHILAMELDESDPAEDIATLQKQLATERDRADYAWRNTNTIEKARQEEMVKRDALQTEAAALKPTIVSLLEILRQWEPDWSSGKDRRTIVMAMYQVGILVDPVETIDAMNAAPHG